MYFYLGLVTKKNLAAGSIVASYVLCKKKKTNGERSPFWIAQPGGSELPKLLVTTINGNEYLVDFFSSYRTRDYAHNDRHHQHKATMKYAPIGALFWFSCDSYGRDNGPAVYIKNVPDKNVAYDMGYQRLKQAMAYKPPLNELYSRDINSIILSTKKPVLSNIA